MYNSKKKWWALIIIFALIISIGGAYYVSITTTWIVTIPSDTPSVTLDLPLDGNISTTNPVLFNWTSVDNDTAPGDLEHMWFLDLIPTMNTPYKITSNTGNSTNYSYNFPLGGTYYWKVEVTDGDTVNASEIRSITFDMHPGNHVPMLTNISLTPDHGNVDTDFNYTVSYTDLDNESPSAIKVCIDGTCYNMIAFNVTDTNYSDGKLYYYNTSLNIGTHNYTFYCEDTWSANMTQIYDGPFVVDNHWPEIVLYTPTPGQVLVTSNVEFTFNVTDVDDNLLYTEVWIWKDGGVKEIHSISNGTILELFAGTYEWQVLAVDSYGQNLSEKWSFGVLATGKQCSVTLQIDDKSMKAGENFTGDLTITNEGPNPSYEVYWYVELWDKAKNKYYSSDAGSKAVTTTVEVSYSVPIDEDLDAGRYYLRAFAYNSTKTNGTIIGQDEVLVTIAVKTIQYTEMNTLWSSLVYDTPRYSVDLSEYPLATQVRLPLEYNYSFLFFEGSRVLNTVKMFTFSNFQFTEIAISKVSVGVYEFVEQEPNCVLIIVPNYSITDRTWLYNWLHTDDIIL